MKLLRFLASLTLVAGLVCMTACSDDDEEDLIIEDETTVNPDEGTGDEEEPGDTEEPKTGISFANEALETVTLDFSEGATATFSIISYESWTGKPAFEEEEEAWFSIEPESGDASEEEQEITVTALSANAGEIRTALLYFTAEDTGEEISVNVTQASPTEGIVLDTESVELENTEGSTVTVTFISYGPWTGSITYPEGDEGEWLSASPASGEGSTSSQTLTLTANANETGAARTATLTLTTESGMTATVSVEQALGYPSEGFVLEQESFTLAETDQSTASVSFTSYGDWTASVSSDADWLTVSPESGNGSIEQQTLTLTAARNYGDSRTATVTLTSGNETATVTATQSATTITIGEPEFTGHLSGHIASESTFVVPFSGVLTSDEISVSVTLSGVKDSLTVADYKETAGTTVGSAVLALEGRPKTAGTLTADITVKVNDVEFLSKKMEETVYVIYMDFEKFVWGGDYVGNKGGVCPNTTAGATHSGGVYKGNETEYNWDYDWTGATTYGACNYTVPAACSILDFSSDWLTKFGLGKSDNSRNDAWYGTNDHMYYHQLRLGYDPYATTPSGYGTLETPVLTWLPQSSGNSVKISVDMCRLENDTFNDHSSESNYYGYIKVDNSTVITTLNSTTLPMVTSTSDLKWTTVTGTATIGTSNYIRIQSTSGSSYVGVIYMTNYKIELQ